MEATISRLLVHTDSDGDSTYAPEYTYDYEGHQYIVKQKKYTNFDGYSVGETVKLFIDPARPEHIQDRKFDLKNIIFAICFFSVFGVIGIVMLLK